MKIKLLLNKMANILHIAALMYIKFTELLSVWRETLAGGNIGKFGIVRHSPN